MGRTIFRGRERSDRQHLTYQPVIAEASIVVGASRERVWDFITAPESLFFMSETVTKAFRVPDTPIGQAGEQICVVHDLGGGVVSADLVEVSSVEKPSMFAARWLTSDGSMIERSKLTALEDGRTLLTLYLELIVPFGEARSAQQPLEASAETSAQRIRSAVESGARFGATADSADSADRPGV